mgnify:CR=1 FL=1
MALLLTDQEIIERSKSMPAFPKVVTDILATLDDDGANLGSLVNHVERDPVITARILSIANSAAMAGHAGSSVNDVRKAVSLIGLAKIREITLAVSLAEFAHGCRMASYFWEHSVAVGICAMELGRFTHHSSEYALVAGLLHDIGQLWMAHFYPLEFQMVRSAISNGSEGINEIERRYFGVDHCHIGRQLAIHWGLPQAVVDAIYFHHELIRIHPFADGNGRITRIAKNWMLMYNLYPPIFINDAHQKKIYINTLASSFRELNRFPQKWNEHTANFFEQELDRLLINSNLLYDAINKIGLNRKQEQY